MAPHFFEDKISFAPSKRLIHIASSMESDARFQHQKDANFMSNFQIQATYKLSSDVPHVYWSGQAKDMLTRTRPLSFRDKLGAVAYVNSHCDPPSGRNDIVRELMQLLGDDLPVHGLGKCLRNSNAADAYGRMQHHDLLRRYRFCISMENSLAPDYVTEKVYMAIAAGWVVHTRRKQSLSASSTLKFYYSCLCLFTLENTGARQFTMESTT